MEGSRNNQIERFLNRTHLWRLVNGYHRIRWWILSRIRRIRNDLVHELGADSDEDIDENDVSYDIDNDTLLCIKDYPSDSSLEEKEKPIRVEYLSVKSDLFRINLLRVIKRRLQVQGFERLEACTKEGLGDGLLKCLKEQMGKERDLAADCLRLLAVELRAEGSSIFRDKIYPELTPLLTDGTTHYKTRAACAMTLATWCYLCSSDLQKFQELRTKLEDMFVPVCGQGDNSLVKRAQGDNSLVTSAQGNNSPVSSGQGDNSQNVIFQQNWLMCHVLKAWCLLLTSCTQDDIQAHINKHMGSLKEFLKSSDEELRITAGETIVLLYEMSKGAKEEFSEEENEAKLCKQLKQLASESVRHRAKTSRRRQKASFRDVYRNVVAFKLEVAALRAKTNVCAITGRECQHHLSK
ncbi:interferon-related developmental regulator 2-like [Physella acuta]|uniref:interferon-related developmental regulator 2-like n=1 Tax=Physella acuta TaxID=109671 RepID=UPI0027DBE9D4|nr:interferon-related developmental regulator 2-like [Physella acuta]